MTMRPVLRVETVINNPRQFKILRVQNTVTCGGAESAAGRPIQLALPAYGSARGPSTTFSGLLQTVQGETHAKAADRGALTLASVAGKAAPSCDHNCFDPNK